MWVVLGTQKKKLKQSLMSRFTTSVKGYFGRRGGEEKIPSIMNNANK